MNITKHNQAEAALRESAERFRLLAESIPVLVWSACPDGTSDYYNSRFLEFLGKTTEEMLGWTWVSTLHPDDQQRSIDAWTEAFLKGTEFRIEYRIRRADGQYRWHIGHALPLRNDAGTIVRWFGTCTDIDDRKRAEEALRHSQEDLNRAQAVAQTGSWRLELDARHNKLHWSDETYRMFGIRQGRALTYETFLGVVHPEDREYVDQKWTMALQGESYDIEHRIIVGDAIKWVREKAELEFGPQGALLGGFGTVQDITERKRAEEALRQVSEQLQDMIKTSPAAIVALDDAGKITLWNKAAEEIFGWTEAEALGQFYVELAVAERDRAEFGALRERLTRGESFTSLQIRRQRKDGSPIYLNGSIAHIYNAQRKVVGTLGVLQDITDRKQAEEALRRLNEELELRVEERTTDLDRANAALQRSEENLRFLTSQTLSAQEKERKRISLELHDEIGQSLTVLKMHLRSIQKKMPARAEKEELEWARNYVNDIVENVRRISKGLSPSLLQDLGLPTGLKQLFEETCKLNGVECSLNTADTHDLLSIEAQIIIYRIFQEILNNITKHSQATRVEMEIKKLDGRVQFSVTDNGKGFDVDQTLASSIKDRGLGLGYMEEQVRMLGGAKNIRSKKGEGTTIKITVPFSRERVRKLYN